MRRAAEWVEALHRQGGSSPDLVAAAELQSDVIYLNSGDPDRIAPPNVLEAAAAALRAGKTRYQRGPGLPELRRAIAAKHLRENAFRVDPDRVSITNGSCEGLAVVMRTLLDPGDEVLTTDPYYGGHLSAIRYAGGRAVFVPTAGETGWEPDPAEIARRITDRTRAFVFASPGNPTGAVYRPELLAELLKLARRHRFLLISDELFERYVYAGAVHTSVASLTAADERVVVVHGFSKSYCMTGWRLGWVTGPEWFMRHFHRVRYSASMAANTFAQHGALEALAESSSDYYREVYQDYGARRELFVAAWERAGLPQRPGPGAFVMMIDVRGLGLAAEELAGIMVERARTVMWPGTRFGGCGEGYLRVGLVVPQGRLRTFATRLGEVVRAGELL
ncbi:MAG: pyridoxal phosphate-dependent aminotransferase [Truepera sp.]|nr:pyridoxal phosphate-dependent aminotransferase [Truepera sp.]